MEEQIVRRRRKWTWLWIIPLAVVTVLAIDSALLMWQDSQTRAVALATAPPPGGGCSSDCGGCGAVPAPAAKDDTAGKDAGATCPAHAAIAAKQDDGATCPAHAPIAAKQDDGATCPAHAAKQDAGATNPTAKSAAAGKCPAGAACGLEAGEPCPHGGDGSCPLAKKTDKPAAAKRAK